ncbi:MAG: polyisoprenoid-binding protein [Candidatus Cloacimonetes bacterium]|nr:polyisoprenoid-binding protein [Candidatus Cloacimonadota bacterium]
MKKLMSIFACTMLLSVSNYASGSHHNHDHSGHAHGHAHAHAPAKKVYHKYVVDTSHSTIGFSVKHMVISNVKGKFGQFDGKLKVDDNNHLHSLDLNMKSASIDTANKKRDNHLRANDFFDAAKYPEIKFWSTKVKSLGGSSYQVTGDFTMKDVTKPVVLNVELNGPIQDPWGNKRFGATVKGEVNRQDYGLSFHKVMEAGGLLVGNDVKIEIELEAIYKK